jgi:hypothetical protein
MKQKYINISKLSRRYENLLMLKNRCKILSLPVQKIKNNATKCTYLLSTQF